MWTKGQSWLRRTYTSLAGMPTETPREVRFNFKIGSNGLQNSQNLSHSFAIPWWVFNQKIKTSLWISWVLKGARKRWGTQEHPQSPKREIWQKKMIQIQSKRNYKSCYKLALNLEPKGLQTFTTTLEQILLYILLIIYSYHLYSP